MIFIAPWRALSSAGTADQSAATSMPASMQSIASFPWGYALQEADPRQRPNGCQQELPIYTQIPQAGSKATMSEAASRSSGAHLEMVLSPSGLNRPRLNTSA